MKKIITIRRYFAIVIIADAKRAADAANSLAPGSPMAYRAMQDYYETRRLAEQARITNNPYVAMQAVETSQRSVNHVNNVVTGRTPNTYSPYDSHGNVYSYYNSSYDTGYIPSPDAPRIKDVDAGNLGNCNKGEKGKEKQSSPYAGELGTITSMVASTSTFIYGLFKSTDADIMAGEAGRLVSEATTWTANKWYDAPIIHNLEKAAQYNQLSRAAVSASKVASAIGVVVDLVYQLKTNESKTAAITKTAGHFLIGLGAAAAVSAAVASAPALAVVAILGGTAISILGSNAVDWAVDYTESKTGVFLKADSAIADIFTGRKELPA